MPLFDFIAYDDSGRARVVIDTRGRVGTGADWAARFRRNVWAHGPAPDGAAFMLVTPDKLYAWSAGLDPNAAPGIEADARTLLAPYFARVGATPESIEPAAFELLVAWWLDDVVRPARPEVTRLLEGSGLLDLLSGARIVHKEAA